MEHIGNYFIAFVEAGGLFAPLLFISFHLLRPLLFIPVIFICITGGVLFGAVAGSLYSVIGITLSSILFYGMIRWMPGTFKKLGTVKEKMLGKHTTVTTSQITILRLIPFIHFHLLSLCLIEMTADFKDYTKSTFISSIPFVFIYTTIGEWLSSLSFIHVALFAIALLPILYLVRKKEVIIKWHDFFNGGTKEKAHLSIDR